MMSDLAYTLDNLHISRGWDSKGPLRATVKFKGRGGSVEIDLGNETSAAVLAVVADQIVAAASMRAEDMKAAFIDGSKSALLGKAAS